MSVANDSLLYNLGVNGFSELDDLSALNASSQTLATCILGQVGRVTASVANGSVVLKSSTTNDAATLIFVVNDSPNAVLVFPAVGEKMGGTLNASLSIPAGQSGIFVRVPVQVAKGGGGGGTVDWRNAVIP